MSHQSNTSLERLVEMREAMNPPSHREREMHVGMIIPFHLLEKRGTVTVEYGVNDDPSRWGYALLGEPADVAKGFPYCRASVVFEGEGYTAVMGWIQIVEYRGSQKDVVVDTTPQLAEVDVPFAYWGFCPTFFDAPSTTSKGLIWTADAFLVRSPDAVMSRVIQPICGFHWGYTTQSELPTLLPLTELPLAAWTRACAVLQVHYPNWVFLPEWVDQTLS